MSKPLSLAPDVPAVALRLMHARHAHMVAEVTAGAASGDGGTAMKMLGTYLKNLAEKPEEEKYRSINAENPKFKQRIAQLIGGVALLTEAAGLVRVG